MTPEQKHQLQEHVTEIARLLYSDAEENQMGMESLGEIEQTIRTQLQRHVSPDLAIFLSRLAQAPSKENDASSTAS